MWDIGSRFSKSPQITVVAVLAAAPHGATRGCASGDAQRYIPDHIDEADRS
jgi:hypothetical protein